MKKVMTYGELVWENRRQEHLREGCEECRKGGCIRTGVDTQFQKIAGERLSSEQVPEEEQEHEENHLNH